MSKADDSRQTNNSNATVAGEDTEDARRASAALRIKIGVIENDMLGEGLATLLSSVDAFDCIGVWNQVPEALLAIQEMRPDLLLLDIKLLQGEGMALFQRLPSISPTTRVFLTMNCPGEWWSSLHSQPLITENAATESLSVREWQVIRLIGQGHSNKDIARELQLGYSTVKNYVSSILRKLRLEGRTQVALLAHQWSGELRIPLPRI